MPKPKDLFSCTECNHQHPQWQGQCNQCKKWNTLEKIQPQPTPSANSTRYSGFAGTEADVKTLSEITLNEQHRLNTGMTEFDRVLGGGLVEGSAILIGGHPGAGKSTILLQITCHLAQNNAVLYVTGEESLQQVAMRAHRLKLKADKLNLMSETNIYNITTYCEKHHPKILVIDSIQTMFHPEAQGAPGGVSQVRESAAYLTQFAKQTNTIILLVGHVTKEGALAGPKVLEHCIDCSITLDNPPDNRYRLMRARKNRFGSVNELGIFAMTELGLKPVKNPSAIFLSHSNNPTPGSSVMVLWEGTRPILVEVQALVDETQYSDPRRVAVGFDPIRLSMLIAIMHRHGGISISGYDIFINAVSGVKIDETASDLALIMALFSSLRNKALPKDLIIFGEVGLAGEIRPVPNGQERLKEATKHGYKRALIPKANAPKDQSTIQTTSVETLQQALNFTREIFN